MKTLQELLKDPRARFKTIMEMKREYGLNWMGNIVHIDENEALQTMAFYGGKVLYPSLIKFKPVTQVCFLYGPTEVRVHECMITTRSLPKYDAKGVELKAGNIVHVEYATGINAGPQKMLVPSALRNEPGVLTRVLKVVKPADYLSDVIPDEDKDRINRFCIAVELHNPASGGFIDIIQKDFKHYFNDGVVRAFEIMFRVAKAEDWQKEYYHKIYSK